MSKDIMNEKEIHEYGINLMINYLEKNDFTISETNKDMDSYPQIIAQKGTEMIFVLVATYVFPTKDVKFDEVVKEYVKEKANQYSAKCYTAKVGLALAKAMDGKELGMAYKNEDFLVKFNGLEEF